MAKAILSADEFLKAIAGDEVEHAIPGVGVVKIRSLTANEVSRLTRQHGDDNVAMMVDGVALGLVAPQLSEEQATQLGKARPGHLVNLWQRISELSGLGDADALEGEAGGGS